MQQLMRDLKFGARILLKHSGTTTLAIAALGLGIGLTTTMFSIVNGAFLRGLPFEEADRILFVGQMRTDRAQQQLSPVLVDDYLQWAGTQRSFEALSAFSDFPADIAAENVAPVRYSGARLAPNALRVLRVRPALGRDFKDEDAVPGAPPVAIIADSIWTNQFSRDAHIIGRVIRVNGEAATIIGVMAPRFGFPQTESVWMPLSATPAAKRADSLRVSLFGRLAPAASIKSANTEMRMLAERVAAQYPENRNVTATAIPFVQAFLGRQLTLTLTMMLVAVFGVLMIACVNVTNLQLARAAERTREVGVRLAMGASRFRMIRQLLVEGVMLSAAGTALGLAIAEAGVKLFMAGIADTSPPFWIDVRLDPRVLLFATGLTIVCALASSLVPAFKVTAQDLNSVIKDFGRGNTSLRMGRFTRALVVAEIMLSFVLLVVSGLMIKSVVEINRINFPFRTDVLQARVEWPERTYRDDGAVRRATEAFRQQVAAAPEVAAAATATAIPDRASEFGLLIDGAPAPARREDTPQVRRMAVSPEFFAVMGISARRGRLLDERDREGQLPVAVVSEDLAAKFFPKGDAIGQRIQLQLRDNADNPWWTIVGVVPRMTVSEGGNTGTSEIAILPIRQLAPRNVIVLATAASGAPGALAPQVRAAAGRVDRDLPLFDIDTVAGVYHSQTWPFRVFGSLFMSFGIAALVMSAAGLYGVMAFSVRRRTQEIGVRMALGAAPRAILGMVVRQGALLVGIGIGAGLGIGGLLGQQMELLLFRVRPWDLTVFGLTTAVLAAAGVAATIVPARRAASVDPLVALRND